MLNVYIVAKLCTVVGDITTSELFATVHINNICNMGRYFL